VGFTDEGNLTTEDQKTYYGLIKQWEDTGRTSAQAFYSIRGLSRILQKKWGTNVINAITSSLRRLRTTPFTWTNSYHDGASGETVREIDMLNILAELKIVQTECDGVVNHAVGYFRFNDFILNNLLSHHTKPLLLDVIFQFKSDIAQLLYVHVDLMLADKDCYERRSKELFDELGLKGAEYRKPSQRKRKLDNALKEFQKIPLSRGTIIHTATTERTKDGTDYKIVIRTTRPTARTADAAQNGKETFTPYQPPQKSLVTVQAEQIVAHFHTLFHNVAQPRPQSKEVNQAVSLIANHGFENAKYIVDFSHRAAAETKYAPQTFGGILQYTSRAIADYEGHQREIEAAARARDVAKSRYATEAREAEAQAKRTALAEARLASLPREEYDLLYATVKADLMKGQFWGTQNEESPIMQRVLRRAMLTAIARRVGDDRGTVRSA
jgi:hypothetical protein